MPVVLIGAAAVCWGGALVARHRAGRTADLAALAAAGAAVRGGAPCPAAARVTAHAGAALESCHELADGSVVVVVAQPLPGLGGPGGVEMGPARARARAGPSP
jgi:secretion/DNA translocation related TadE-like protein